MPQEVQAKLKEWIRTREELSEDDALKMTGEVKRALLLKGIPLGKGFRGVPVERIARIETSKREDEREPQESEDEDDTETARLRLKQDWERNRTNVEVNRDVNFVNSRKTRPPGRRWPAPQNQVLICYGCGKPGHLARNCPERRYETYQQTGYRANRFQGRWDHGKDSRNQANWRGKERILQVSTGEGAVSVHVIIGGERLAAILDTGASPCVMDSNTAKKTKLFESMIANPTDVYGLCSNPVPVLGYADAEIRIEKGEPTTQRIQILDTDEPTLLLGRTFMQKLGSMEFDFERDRIKLGKHWLDVENTVKGATPLARAQVVKREEELDGSIAEETVELLGPELVEGQRNLIEALALQYEGIFSRNRRQPTRTKFDVHHAIVTADNPPQSPRPRRVPPSWETEINHQLEEMMGANPPICRPSNSPWSSDVVLVKKKDGSLRFAVDYRRLNAITKRDQYSLPNRIFDKLRGSCFFSKLDIASAYWTVPIRESDIEKTAFHTPRGLFEMIVMPFGLCNSQATFQRLIDRALRGVSNAESFVDDILIFFNSFEEHLSNLRDVFQRLEFAGLQLRKDKCRLAYRGVEFLGHWISEEGRSPLTGYAKRVHSFSRPNNVKELQRYLGMANYYRCYIRNFSMVAEPLYTLTRTGQKWYWDEQCERAFDELRNRLLKEPVMLTYPCWEREFHIETDACATGVGGVLGQMDERTGKIRPIEYFSSALSSSQRNYSAGQLEAWAAIAASRKWAVYLKGSVGVVLHTDHSPLKWILTQRDPKPTFTRWLMELQEIPLRIETRSGKDNIVADYLSRKPDQELDEDVNAEDMFEEKVFQVHSREALQRKIERGQREDPVIRNAVSQIQSQGGVSKGQLKGVGEKLNIQNGILLFENRIIVPQKTRLEVLERVHSQHHLGANGTLQSLRNSYFWIKMNRDTRMYCRGCLTCHRAKPMNKGREPVQEMDISKGIPGYAVGIDVGTLPWAEGGYRYCLLMVDLFHRNLTRIVT